MIPSRGRASAANTSRPTHPPKRPVEITGIVRVLGQSGKSMTAVTTAATRSTVEAGDEAAVATTSLSWSGRVDDMVEIQLSGRRVDAITRRGVQVSDVHANIRGGGLPKRNVNLRIDQRSGRGSISVVQQPSAWNRFTAIIRINDSRSGAAYYDLAAYWE